MSTGTESTSTYWIESLYSTANYNIGHIKMRHILIDLSLFKYVEFTVLHLTADKSNESAIEISKEAWDILKRMYKATSTVSIIATHWKLLRIYYPEETNTKEYIYTLCGLCQQLASSGQAMLRLDVDI